MIKTVKFYLLLLTEYLFLGKQIVSIMAKFDEATLKLTMAKSKITNALTKLEQSMKIVKGSLLTDNVNSADTARDNAWYALYHYIIACSYSYNNDIRTNAELLLSVIKLPEMRIANLGLKKQSAVLINFFNRIDSMPEFVAALTATNANEYYTTLKEKQTAFELVYAERNQKDSAKQKSESEEASRELRVAIDELNQFLNVMNNMNPNGDYEKISQEINEVIDSVNTTAQSRTTRRQNKAEEVATEQQN